MPSLIGAAYFNSESYRDNIYNYIVENSTKCIRWKKIEKYGVSPTTGTYGIGLRLHFLKMNESLRDRLKTKIKNVKDDPRTITGGMEIKIYKSNSDGIPGTCQPGIIEEVIKK